MLADVVIHVLGDDVHLDGIRHKLEILPAEETWQSRRLDGYKFANFSQVFEIVWFLECVLPVVGPIILQLGVDLDQLIRCQATAEPLAFE